MKSRLAVLLLICFYYFSGYAQNVSLVDTFVADLTKLRNNIAADYKKTTHQPSPYYFRLINPSIYSANALKNKLTLDSISRSDNADILNDFIDDRLIDIYLNNPSKVKYSNIQVDSQSLITTDSIKISSPTTQNVENILNTELKDVKPSDIDTHIDDIGIKIERPNFWKTTGQASLQFSQNYFSENWYKGGNNNQNLLASIILQANYNDQRKVSWENKLEMRLGFMTTTSDSCHKFLTSNDKLNLHSKLGVKATKSWYYTITAEANTQFMKGHRSNDKRTYSNFLAPLDVFLSIGMDFKPTFKNGNTFSLALLPLSYKIRHLNDDDENIHSVYNMVGKNTQKDYGSKMELNTRLKIAKDFYWKSRCYYYTSYSYAEAELENSFTYAFSKYINAEVYTLWRFDDNRAKKYFDDNLGYFQFKEYFTLGMTYSF